MCVFFIEIGNFPKIFIYVVVFFFFCVEFLFMYLGIMFVYETCVLNTNTFINLQLKKYSCIIIFHIV